MNQYATTGLVGVVFCCGTTIAADHHVPADFATIQEAIDAAASGDRILVADGVYAGPGNVDLDPGGKPHWGACPLLPAP